MTKALFKPLLLDSPALLPVNIFERIPENHPLHLINDGTIYSCRKIAKALDENKYLMGISGNSTPDFGRLTIVEGKESNTTFTIYLQR